MTPHQHQKAVEEIAHFLYNPSIPDSVKAPIFYMGTHADMFLHHNKGMTDLVHVYTDACTYLGFKHADIYNRLTELCTHWVKNDT